MVLYDHIVSELRSSHVVSDENFLLRLFLTFTSIKIMPTASKVFFQSSKFAVVRHYYFNLEDSIRVLLKFSLEDLELSS